MSACALILIDLQTGFDDAAYWGARNNPHAEKKAGMLLAAWRAMGAPVVHIRHRSVQPNSPLSGTGIAFKPEATPTQGEPIFEKTVNSAFIGTPLEGYLRGRDVSRLVICGLTTPHCVSTSTRMAANLGFEVRLAHDACAAFAGNADASWRHPGDAPPASAEDIHRAAIDQLHGEFAQAVATADLVAAQP